MLGGYLLLAGSEGLAHVEKKLLRNPQAPIGDVRHAVTALRFVHEFGEDAISAIDICAPCARCSIDRSWLPRQSSTWHAGKIGIRSHW